MSLSNSLILNDSTQDSSLALERLTLYTAPKTLMTIERNAKQPRLSQCWLTLGIPDTHHQYVCKPLHGMLNPC
jgi:hypothetical protein